MARVPSISTIATVVIGLISFGSAKLPASAASTGTSTNPETSSSEANTGAHRSSPKADHPADDKNERSLISDNERFPVFDHGKQAPETIVVPAGTKITVDISEENPPRNVSRVHPGKVINIVQVGSTVVIPALSTVAIQESAGVMQLTEVTLDGIRYELQTDHVARQEGSMSEATFTLTKSFTIKR